MEGDADHMVALRKVTGVIVSLVSLVTVSVFVEPVGQAQLLVSDGVTPVLTPEGTYTVVAPGTPLPLILDDTLDAGQVLTSGVLPLFVDGNVTCVPQIGVSCGVGSDQTNAKTTNTGSGSSPPPPPPCSGHVAQAGWTQYSSVDNGREKGGYATLFVQGLPYSVSNLCPGSGMAFWMGFPFTTTTYTSYIQAGWVVLESGGGGYAQAFCQSQFNGGPEHGGTRTTKFVPSHAGNGDGSVFQAIIDSKGTWRTYQGSAEMGCTLSGVGSTTGGQPVQYVAEDNYEKNVNAKMGPFRFTSLAYYDGSLQYRHPSKVLTWYVPSGPNGQWQSGGYCPPYTAGYVTNGGWDVTPGSLPETTPCTSGWMTYGS